MINCLRKVYVPIKFENNLKTTLTLLYYIVTIISNILFEIRKIIISCIDTDISR